LDPLWWLAAGAVAAIVLSLGPAAALSPALPRILAVGGGGAVALALAVRDRRRVLLLALAGLALGGWRGLEQVASSHRLDALMHAEPPAAVRVTVRVLTGWRPTQWGSAAGVRVVDARRAHEPVALPRRCRLEVRSPSGRPLPRPGETLEVLVALRGDPAGVLLVASSGRLLRSVADAHGLPALRDALAGGLLAAAGTDAERIRAAELAAALALGRRDLVPHDRVDGWRRSGLGHALAVSGLHVGVVAGVCWLTALACGLGPGVSRLVLLAAVPAYVLLAGASPSAVRAGIMICVFLVARLAGRAVIPLAAVILTATLMLLVSPELLRQPGFQLTVLITGALVRWTPILVDALPGPRWLTAAAAVPVIAQLAAAPIVGTHFRTLIPLAAVVNLAVPCLLTPAIPCAVAAVALSSLWPPAGAPLLDALSAVTRLLWAIGGLGRSWFMVTPSTPAVAVVALAVAGAFALRLDRAARFGAVVWLAVIGLQPVLGLISGPRRDGVELLGVGDGTAVLANAAGTTVLFDAGRYRSEAAQLLADAGVRSIDVALASHGDSDHTGGLEAVLLGRTVRCFALPRWLIRDESAVDLLRTARRCGTRIVPLVAGSSVRVRGARLDVVWPPAGAPTGWTRNDRSLVVRIAWPAGRAVLTGDIGGRVEERLARTVDLACDVLVVAHHGSRSSTTAAFLDAAGPKVALIPAGPMNRHNHPHPDVVRRLTRRHIAVRLPISEGRSGARPANGRWELWP
jgi:competence protein ComEC